MCRHSSTSPLNPSRLLKTTSNCVVSRAPSSHTLTAYAPVVPLPAALLGCRFEQPQMMPLFVVEREQTLALVNKRNVQLQDPDDPGSSRGTKKSSP